MTYITHYCEWGTGKGSKCANALTEAAYNYSMEHYNKGLCWGHQKRSEENPNTYESVKEYEEIFNVS
jgi:hypothetical protein